MLVIVNVPWASGVQLADSEMTGTSDVELGTAGRAARVRDLGVDVGVRVGGLVLVEMGAAETVAGVLARPDVNAVPTENRTVAIKTNTTRRFGFIRTTYR